MMYRVQATVARDVGDGWTSTTQVPTYYLDSEQLGLRSSAEVEGFARAMLESLAGDCSRAFVVVGCE